MKVVTGKGNATLREIARSDTIFGAKLDNLLSEFARAVLADDQVSANFARSKIIRLIESLML